MSTIHGITELRQTTAKRQVYSPLEKYWDAFWDAYQGWRKRERLPTLLCHLSERELPDIGITPGDIDYVTSNRWRRDVTTPRHPTGWHGAVIIMLLCNTCSLVFASEAKAQCTARDGLQNQLRLKKTSSPIMPQVLVRSAVDVPVWKKITIGTFSDSFALRNALHAVGCGTGGLAGEILARPAFTLSVTKTDLELFTVLAAELGFQTETASLEKIYARAQQLGFGLAAAEIAPHLRLQYLDQPIGEFLIIGMEPIKTWEGEPVILTVANGGAGLILIGQDGHADAEIFVTSRFVFVRSHKAAPAEAALVHH
jgi:uncharacterized protein YjiS (DUF1127 family)